MTEMSDILRTIREVETSLERRAARAEGVNIVIWGLVGATIFAFYQLVTLQHALYEDALGVWVNWVWVLPMLVGYAASMMVGARLGRIGVDAERRRIYRLSAIPGLVTAALVTFLLLTERYHYIYGGVVLVAGAANFAFAAQAPRGPARTAGFASGTLLGIVGLVNLLAPTTWSSGIAALAFLLGYGTLGTVKYRLGR